jgi:[Skp1-protein]-hydroxyproline N-acetylglucosaminyltransferase
MIFQGEEISMTLRGYSYGYDYYAPENGVCFHMLYAVKENLLKRKRYRSFGKIGASLQGMKRLNSLIGLIQYPADQWPPQDDKSKYGLGQIRDTANFFQSLWHSHGE